MRSARPANASVSLPLPSSPHWPPMMIVAGMFRWCSLDIARRRRSSKRRKDYRRNQLFGCRRGTKVVQFFDEFSLALRQFRRQDDADPRQKIASAPALFRHPLAPEPEHFAGLGLSGDCQRDAASRGLNHDLAAEERGIERNGNVGAKVIAFTLEFPALRYPHAKIDITIGTAVDAGSTLGWNANPRAVGDSGGNFDLQRPALGYEAGGIAGRAGRFADIARAAAGGAGFLDLNIDTPDRAPERLV